MGELYVKGMTRVTDAPVPAEPTADLSEDCCLVAPFCWWSGTAQPHPGEDSAPDDVGVFCLPCYRQILAESIPRCMECGRFRKSDQLDHDYSTPDDPWVHCKNSCAQQLELA